MNLVIDIGNTRIKTGLFSENELIKKFSFQSFADKNWFEKAYSEFNFDQCIVSSTKVLPEESLEFLKSRGAYILDHQLPIPIIIDYKTPVTLGRDRIAGAIGARFKYPNYDCLVIDLGTCVTYDFISKQGIFKGGAISPGLKMRFQALHDYTDLLPLIENPTFLSDFGQSTTESINMGVYNGMTQEINGFIRYFLHKSKRLKVILTGGDASMFEQHIENAIFAHPNLILDGLNQVLLYNKQLNE